MFYSTRHFIRLVFILPVLYILGRGIPWERAAARAGRCLQRAERAVSSAGRKAARPVREGQEGVQRTVDRYLR
jgi:hypothetical protein